VLPLPGNRLRANEYRTRAGRTNELASSSAVFEDEEEDDDDDDDENNLLERARPRER
jgi:hypothetical protein